MCGDFSGHHLDLDLRWLICQVAQSISFFPGICFPSVFLVCMLIKELTTGITTRLLLELLPNVCPLANRTQIAGASLMARWLPSATTSRRLATPVKAGCASSDLGCSVHGDQYLFRSCLCPEAFVSCLLKTASMYMRRLLLFQTRLEVPSNLSC